MGDKRKLNNRWVLHVHDRFPQDIDAIDFAAMVAAFQNALMAEAGASRAVAAVSVVGKHTSSDVTTFEVPVALQPDAARIGRALHTGSAAGLRRETRAFVREFHAHTGRASFGLEGDLQSVSPELAGAEDIDCAPLSFYASNITLLVNVIGLVQTDDTWKATVETPERNMGQITVPAVPKTLVERFSTSLIKRTLVLLQGRCHEWTSTVPIRPRQMSVTSAEPWTDDPASLAGVLAEFPLHRTEEGDR